MSLLLQVQGLVIGWQQPVARPLDFSLSGGEVVGVTGPNGVGKTTLLATLAGRTPPLAGQITRSSGMRLAWQRQELPPVAGLPLSGRELLALTGATPAGLPPWLMDKLDRRLDRLSGGQRHYLCLWAALQTPADLLLLDEPTNHLDMAGVAHLADALRQRAAAGVGVLVVSHDADFVAVACDRRLPILPHQSVAGEVGRG